MYELDLSTPYCIGLWDRFQRLATSFSQPTPYRGADAGNLQAEFLAYGLNETVFILLVG